MGVLALSEHDFIGIIIVYLWFRVIPYLLSSQMLSTSLHKIAGCSINRNKFSHFQTNLLIFWKSKLLNIIELYLIGENEAYEISILVFFCIYKQGPREIQSAKRDFTKHQYRIRILCLDYLATLSKEWISFLRPETHRMIK